AALTGTHPTECVLRNWLRSLFGRRSTAKARAGRAVQLQVEPLEDRIVPTITYHGGALLHHVEVQAVYLGSDWTRASYLPQTRSLDNFVKTLVSGSYMDSLTAAGYGVGRGSADPGQL